MEATGFTKSQVTGMVRGLLSEMHPPEKRLLPLADGDFSKVVQIGELLSWDIALKHL
jgi:hypothetical protein